MPSQTFFNLSEKKKERILEAAIVEFGRKNVAEGRLSAVAKLAKVARGSMYQYFDSKEELYAYVFNTVRARRADYVKPAFEIYKKATFVEFFKKFYYLDAEYLLKNPSHINLGKHLYASPPDISIRLILNLKTQYKEIFLVAIEYDKGKGLIKKETDSSTLAELCARFVTDDFIFSNIFHTITLDNLKSHIDKKFHIIEYGISQTP
jgi:AcrR family transcriptional regulator